MTSAHFNGKSSKKKEIVETTGPLCDTNKTEIMAFGDRKLRHSIHMAEERPPTLHLENVCLRHSMVHNRDMDKNVRKTKSNDRTSKDTIKKRRLRLFGYTCRTNGKIQIKRVPLW